MTRDPIQRQLHSAFEKIQRQVDQEIFREATASLPGLLAGHTAVSTSSASELSIAELKNTVAKIQKQTEELNSKLFFYEGTIAQFREELKRQGVESIPGDEAFPGPFGFPYLGSLSVVERGSKVLIGTDEAIRRHDEFMAIGPNLNYFPVIRD